MSDPVNYSFYGTTVPVLRSIAATAIGVLTAAKDERSKATDGTLPSEQEILDANFADMLPLRLQPILLAKFPLQALESLGLSGSATIPAFDPGFSSLDDVIEFFKQTMAVYDAIDETKYNESAGKSVDVAIKPGTTLHMRGLADYFHGFIIPNCYFHLSAMYMLLRSKGFALGKGVYVGSFMSKQLQEDWAPLRK